MTDTTTSPTPEGITLEQLDPHTLLLDRNVRREATPDKTLVESVRDLGVLVPLVAVRDQDGVRVRYGHRRTLAAIEAGRPTVPAWVVDAVAAGTEVDRIVAQWAENEHRENLTDADRLAAVEQLSAFGVSAAQITKRLKTERAQVNAALTVAGSALAKAATERYDFLTLDQAAVLAEFDAEEDADTVKALVLAAKDGPGRFTHAAQRARDERAQAQRERTAREAIAASVPVLDGRCPQWGAIGTTARLADLADDAGQVLTPAGHAACPGHAAYLVVEYDYWTEEQAATVLLADPTNPEAGDQGAGGGEQVDPEDLDPGDLDPQDYETEDYETEDYRTEDYRTEDYRTEDYRTEDYRTEAEAGDDSGNAGEGSGRAWRGRYAAAYVCTDFAAHGHTPRWGRTDQGSRDTAPLTEAEETERKEAARAERRRVIENNKAWRSAGTVRREWLRIFLSRKTPPKGAAGFLARRMATGAYDFARAAQEGHPLACELFGVERRAGYYRSTPSGLWGLLDGASDARAQVVTLGLVLAATEAATGTHSWRNVDPDTAAYLRFLDEHGYTLTGVERLACGEQPPPTPGHEDGDGEDG